MKKDMPRLHRGERNNACAMRGNFIFNCVYDKSVRSLCSGYMCVFVSGSLRKVIKQTLVQHILDENQ